MIDVTITAHTSNDIHACDTLCARRITENPLRDLRFATTFAAMRGNRFLRAACCSSVHCVMSVISHAPMSFRVHLPPNLSMWHRSRTKSETLSEPMMRVCFDMSE